MVLASGRRVEGSQLMTAYWRDIDHIALLDADTEVELARRARAGDAAARERLVTANLRFVVRIAREYAGRGLSLPELVSEGNMGLIKAVDRYDETRGCKFITYAVWWIRQRMLKALAQAGRARRAPMSRINDLRQLERRQRSLSQRLGREPSLEEVGEDTSLNGRRVRNALEESRSDVSMDAPLFADGGRGLDSLLAERGADADEELAGVELAEMLGECLAGLEGRERLVLCSYFGLRGYSPTTLEQIGAVLGVTRERVRQLRDAALAKLRREAGEALLPFCHN